jgi:hypothetical protein
MAGKILLSTAYFPPVDYIALLYEADEIFIEREENYLKQTYRNRCNILAANGPLTLSVPVLTSKLPKTRISDVKIDYSKRWQQVHHRAIISAYRSAAYFEYFFDAVEKVILERNEFLLDLNLASIEVMLKLLKIEKKISYTSEYVPDNNDPQDFRYRISPKKKPADLPALQKKYFQVFSNKYSFVPRLSFLDMLFNLGPESPGFFSSSPVNRTK